MGRDRRKKGHDTTRDAGQFVALPCVVLDCPNYLNLSHPAKSLLLEIARQYNRDNNGRLLASRAHLLDRGWTSNDTITRALKELLAAKLIHQTVMGCRPNKASWYALTWRTLDRHPGYDHGAVESFLRGAYKNTPLKNDGATPPDGANKNARLKPSDGAERPKIAPPDGVELHPIAPPDGAIKGVFGASPTPPDGDHLDKPSTGARQRAHAHHNDCVNHAPDHGHERHAGSGPVRMLTYTPAPFAMLTIDSG
ncbi:hypothetical protein [Limnohabitans sp. T6-5]|uniref:hypothetical protein n=1 Tax=Limnohabitans sp. T6-5 TaxID=1100724 RepID=UPI0018EE8FFB|nr:hypothetical protein [Limnohabitans sp. T6-5]